MHAAYVCNTSSMNWFSLICSGKLIAQFVNNWPTLIIKLSGCKYEIVIMKFQNKFT